MVCGAGFFKKRGVTKETPFDVNGGVREFPPLDPA